MALLLLAVFVGLATGQAQPAPKVVVSDILIQGSRNVPPENVRNQLKTRIGQVYSPSVLQDDVRTLYATRQFANVWADLREDGPGRVKVIFFIKDHISVVKKVEYKGNVRLSNDDLDGITQLRRGMPCNPQANKAACQNIVKRYRDEGRPWASCTLLKGSEPGDTEVIFNITEGPIVRIRSITFTGNTFVSGDVLRNRITSGAMFLRIPLFGGTLNPAMLDHDVSQLINYYRGFGYQDVRVSKELSYSPNGRFVDVIFHIQEGPRYRVLSAPQVINAKYVPREALEAINTQKAGEFYSQAEVDKSVARIQAYGGAAGHQTKVVPETVLVPDKPGFVQVNYQLMEEPQARVGQIIIIGNDRTAQNVILRQMPIYPGQVLSYPDLKVAEANLARLNIFEMSPDGSTRPTVEVRNNPFMPDSPFKDVIVNVRETSTGSLMFGLGVNSDAGFTGSIVLNERNFDLFRLPTSLEDAISGNAFRGAGQEFRIEAVPGTQVQRYMVSFREPFLLDSPYSLTTSAYYFQRYFNEYNEDRLGARFTLGRKIADYWSIAGTVRVEDVGVKNVPFWSPVDYLSVQGDNFLVGGRLGVTYDDRDNVLRPTSGQLFDVSVEQCFGDNKPFTLAQIDYSRYWTVMQRPDGSGKHVVSFHHQSGWASDDTPVYERYFGGGFRSIRGFQFRGVGPEVAGAKVGGDFMFLNSLEYQMPIRASENVFLVGFVDSGTVSRRIDNWDTYRVSAGVGVRFKVPMLGPVPIALDFGFPIVKGKFDNTQVFMFWMGFTR
jgi:outer membrane protein assembly factor BamA